MKRNKILQLFVICINIIIVDICYGAHKTIVTNAVEPVTYFVNHSTEITHLREHLIKNKKVALVGISGIGKTQLARKYVQNNPNNYKIIWFFDSNLELDEQYINLNKKINILNLAKIKLSEDAKDAKQDLLNFLAARNDWLLVFDNLKINENYKIKDILEWDHNGHVIIGTQSADGLKDVIKLAFLKMEDTRTLVKKIMNYEDNNFVKQLTDIYRGYPVMVVQATQYLNNNQHLTMGEYHKMIKQSSDQLQSHLQLVLKELSSEGKRILYTIALINNQSFSKELLERLINLDQSFIGNLQKLTSLGLVNSINTKEQFHILEMHDLIKDNILQILSEQDKQQITTNIIRELDKLLQGNIHQVRHQVASDPTLLGNLEILLKNTELYKVDILKQMALRKTLIMFYSAQSNFVNINKMAKWLEVQENTHTIKLDNMDDHHKEIYAWYLIYRGLYREFTDGNYEDSIADLNQARFIIEKYSKDIDLTFNTYVNIAQITVWRGDLETTEKMLDKCNKLIEQNPHHNFDKLWYSYFRARLATVKGEYGIALDTINRTIQYVENKSDKIQDAFNFPPYILKTEILNRLGRYQESKAIGDKLLKDAKKLKLQDYEQQCRILTFLAEAELNLRNISQSEEYIKEAKEDLNKIPGRLQQGLSQSIDFDLANAYIVEGKIFTVKKEYKYAMDSFKTAEQIYLNRLKNNKKIDKISLLYKDMGEVMSLEKNPNGILEYFNKHHSIFGKSNDRSVAIFKLYLQHTH